MAAATLSSENTLSGRRIVLGITGSIAAYKSAVLARELQRRGATVKVVMTAGAVEFITPLTLATLVDHPVHSDFTENRDSGVWTNHVELGLWADLVLVAPATAAPWRSWCPANATTAAGGVALGQSPVAVAPAMDLDMFAHASTQANLATLRNRGVVVIDSDTAHWPYRGKGRMAEPEAIDHLDAWFAEGLYAGKRVVITAGPTHEPLDAVRFLGNRSSGKMGFALAEALAEAGAEVHLVAGPVALPTPDRVHARHDVQTAQEMLEAVRPLWPSMDMGIACAAVSDFRPAQTSDSKWHRGEVPSAIELVENPDILMHMGEAKADHQFLVGFALETDDGVASAKSKLACKNLDAIVLNTLADDGAGFSVDTNKVTVLHRDTKSVSFELKSKRDLARDLVRLWIQPNTA